MMTREQMKMILQLRTMLEEFIKEDDFVESINTILVTNMISSDYISDELKKFITDELFNRLLFKTAEQLQDKQFKQIDIYNVLQKYNLSNKTVARIINELIPTAHATQGSVTSLVWNYNKNNPKDKYSKELEEMLLDD